MPTVILHTLLYAPGRIRWFDVYLAATYVTHFIVPLLVAFGFWLVDRALFKRYMLAMVVLSYLAFFTYVVFPAMPPWMAGQLGYIPPVHRILVHAVGSFA